MIATRRSVAADRALRILAILEANTVTGPAANLLQFQRTTRQGVRLVVAVFKRRAASVGHPARASAEGDGGSSPLTAVAEAAGLRMVSIPERGRFDPGVLGAVRRLAATLQPDVVQTHSVKSHLVAVASG